VENRHIIWGALINGPDGNDGHIDNRADFGSNEVTIDYNTSLIAALAAQYDLQGQGQCPLTNFPPLEPEGNEYYTLSNSNDAGGCRSQITVTLVNETSHVPRYDTHISVKYFFDISELLAKGRSINDVTASLIYDRGATEFGEPTSISKPQVCPRAPRTTIVRWLEAMSSGANRAAQAPRTFMIEHWVNNGAGCTWDPSND